MKKLNVGDRVKMVRPSCYSFDREGNTGTVVELDMGRVMVSVDGQRKPTIGDGWCYFESAENWELLKEESKMAKFKVGDKVVIKDDLNFHNFENGEVVVIKEVDRYGGYTGYRVGDSPESWMCFDDREIEEYKEEVKVQKFKVGDKVRMVKLRSDGLSYSFDKIGNEGVVTGIGSKFIQVDVHCKGNTWGGDGWTYPLENKCWELVEEKSKLRVTSKVEPMCIYSFDSVEDMRTFLKIADQDGFDTGSCERGIEKYGSDTKFRVTDDEYVTYGTYGYDTPRFPEYERVQFKVEEEKEMPKCKFEVGDLVKGNDPHRYFYTDDKMTKGVVLEVHNHDDIKVKILEHTMKEVIGDAYNVDPQYFDFYEEPKKDAVVTTKFKVGDKVKVVRLNSDFDYLDYPGEKNIGMVGTIHELLPKGCTIDCEFEVPLWFHYDALELVQNEKPKTTVLKLGEYKIVFNGDTTVITDGTRKGVAKRHPDDEYSAVVGLQVALERFHGGRKPKPGNKVRVLKVDENSRYGRHSYSIGDIVTVIDFAYGDGGKGTDILCHNSKHGRFYLEQTLIAGEYEVLG